MPSRSLIEDIALFTSQRDEELIAYSLIRTVSDLISSKKVGVLAIDRDGKTDYCVFYEAGEKTSKESNEKIESDIEDAIKQIKQSSEDEILLKRSEGFLLVRLLTYNRRGEKYMIAYLDAKIGPKYNLALNSIFSIYNNFISLLQESQTDELTGLANRKTFEVALSKISDLTSERKFTENERRVKISGQLYWLALLDIDNFKKVNDTYGHVFGDEILINVGQILNQSFRKGDFLFRYGGEEFVALINAKDKAGCDLVLNRFQQKLREFSFPRVDKVTVSIGVVQFNKDVFHATTMDYADQALYYSKENGKDRITYFEDMIESGEATQAQIESGEIDFF